MPEELSGIARDNEFYELNRMTDRMEREDYFGVPLKVDFTSVPGKVIITKVEEDEDEEE